MLKIVTILILPIIIFNIGLETYKNSGGYINRYNSKNTLVDLNEYLFKEYADNKLRLYKFQFLYSKEYLKKYYGYVADKNRAVAIAESYLVPIYGFSVYKQKPYTVVNKNGLWVVRGNLEPPGFIFKDGEYLEIGTVGGTFNIAIRQRDGKILQINHGK